MTTTKEEFTVKKIIDFLILMAIGTAVVWYFVVPWIMDTLPNPTGIPVPSGFKTVSHNPEIHSVAQVAVKMLYPDHPKYTLFKIYKAAQKRGEDGTEYFLVLTVKAFKTKPIFHVILRKDGHGGFTIREQKCYGNDVQF